MNNSFDNINVSLLMEHMRLKIEDIVTKEFLFQQNTKATRENMKHIILSHLSHMLPNMNLIEINTDVEPPNLLEITYDGVTTVVSASCKQEPK